MGMVYSVELKIKSSVFPKPDALSDIKLGEIFGENGNFSEIIEEKNGFTTYTADFDAQYSWFTKMTDYFESVALFLEDGSYLHIQADSDPMKEWEVVNHKAYFYYSEYAVNVIDKNTDKFLYHYACYETLDAAKEAAEDIDLKPNEAYKIRELKYIEMI
jgi:hypothetical protein